MPRGHWLVKSEPFKYSWDQLVEDGSTLWDGVRNYEARNNLQAMKVGDLALYYHSNEGKEVVGVARIVVEAYPDPTIDDPTWVVVELAPVQRLEEPVTLADVKADPLLGQMFLVKRGRISVVPVTPPEFERVLALGKTALREGATPEKLPPRPSAKRNSGARKSAATRLKTGAANQQKKQPRQQRKKKAARSRTGGRRR
jgi:predicted RNA-binding protein with PUA-like domain